MDNNETVFSYQYGNFDEKKNENTGYVVEEKKKGLPGFVKAIIIIAVVILLVALLANFVIDKLGSEIGYILGDSNSSNSVYLNYSDDYVATIYIDGEIAVTSSGTYNHEYILNLLEELKYDEHNKGIILWVDTPGGSVFATDELYLKLKEYKEETNRPIYSSFQNQATSGGYYAACLSDKIIINRNCWTGSIGVTLGSMLDVSGLLDKLGVKVNTITAGANKAMGSYYEEMTEEQRAIFQSLVDEAYEQFTDIVSCERNMPLDKVVELADGRVYTAKQSLENGLCDVIGTYEDTIDQICDLLGNDDLSIVEFRTYDSGSSLFSLLTAVEKNENSKSNIEELLELNGTFEISYMSTIKK